MIESARGIIVVVRREEEFLKNPMFWQNGHPNFVSPLAVCWAGRCGMNGAHCTWESLGLDNSQTDEDMKGKRKEKTIQVNKGSLFQKHSRRTLVLLGTDDLISKNGGC